MAGQSYPNLSDSELKSVLTFTERVSWNIVRPIIASLGLSTGKGRLATNDKILDELSKLKKSNQIEFDKKLKSINDLLDGMIMYGEKALFSLDVDKKVVSSLQKSFTTKWAAMKQKSSLSEEILDKKSISKISKNHPELIYHTQHNNITTVIYSSVRDRIIQEKVPLQKLPQLSGYDEVIAKRKEKRQCFDLCILTDNRIHILIDIRVDSSGENILFSKSSIVRELYQLYGSNFSAKEKDFYPLIDPIFEQASLPFSQHSYKVFDLSFLTNEGTTHKEKKNSSDKDLRDDLFNKEGIKAVGKIGLYRIGIRIKRNNPQLLLADNIELIVPGTLRRHLGGSSVSPVSYALLSKCICKDDFETLARMIL
ncbi:hypothetical protein HGT71_14365 [Rosenbergiella epipactidis]|uniref:hypothetical protein n=1 Tax=Rosenbergiella epipactidis TaxID=1544694 RepID=UPI001BDAD935|nr:hypothetical protein [Rosenbergiella epipactidis]MBT0719430.1 hypothetical protein [Rosenbergiella epipactidis]